MNPDEMFLELFKGNHLVLGSEEGGCIRLDDNGQLWEYGMFGHLDGDNPIGVYPVHMSKVAWGCVDFDEGDHDSWIHAQNLRGILMRFGIRSWIEKSRSKGYHVWVFVNGWMAMKTMRHALLYACELVKAPTKEINPKQESLADDEIGNYVRLPYPGRGDHDGRRCFVGDHNEPLEFEESIEDAYRYRVEPGAIEALASRYTPPPPPDMSAPIATDGTPWWSRLSNYIKKIIEEGPLDGDRSGCLYKIAQLVAEDGKHTAQECYLILEEADRKWGKFSQRRDKETRLMEIVEKTWTARFKSETA